jgi:putative hemolysin
MTAAAQQQTPKSAGPETPAPTYRARMAATPAEVRAAQQLRFRVFNLELNQGLAASYEIGLDQDQFDACCDHLVVEHIATGEVVGTYRVQSGTVALQNKGFYSASEFDLSAFIPIADEVLEIGRACIHEEHRNSHVLRLLWKAIGTYATDRKVRYLIGCSSVSSQSPEVGMALYATLAGHLSPAHLRTEPLHPCRVADPADKPPTTGLPRLLLSYLALGAWIAGPPALDEHFKTIDFLTVLDLSSLSPRATATFLRPTTPPAN